MTREELIKEMRLAGSRIAKKYGLDTMKVGEDRQKGIWGEGLTQYLENKEGPCDMFVNWTNGVDKYPCVDFDFRFATPRLGMRDATGNIGFYAEVYWPWDSEAKDYKRDEPFEVIETICFHPEKGGNIYSREILSRIRRILKRQ